MMNGSDPIRLQDYMEPIDESLIPEEVRNQILQEIDEEIARNQAEFERDVEREYYIRNDSVLEQIRNDIEAMRGEIATERTLLRQRQEEKNNRDMEISNMMAEIRRLQRELDDKECTLDNITNEAELRDRIDKKVAEERKVVDDEIDAANTRLASLKSENEAVVRASSDLQNRIEELMAWMERLDKDDDEPGKTLLKRSKKVRDARENVISLARVLIDEVEGLNRARKGTHERMLNVPTEQQITAMIHSPKQDALKKMLADLNNEIRQLIDKVK